MNMKFLITLFILAVCTKTVQSTKRKTQRNFIYSMKSVVGRICSDITTMKEKMMNLETENDELKKKVRDLEQIGNQKDPVLAFSAYVDENTSPSGADDVYVFNKVLTNVGQAYDDSTGVFTCPIKGIYVFTFVAGAKLRANADSYAYARLMVNGTEILHAVADATRDFQEDQGANIAVVQCNKDDEVWVTGKEELPGESNTRTSSFSGFLLHQTTD